MYINDSDDELELALSPTPTQGTSSSAPHHQRSVSSSEPLRRATRSSSGIRIPTRHYVPGVK
jgi:hypothetical protein